MTEIQKRKAWNASMLRTLRECSPQARSWIEAMIRLNQAIISEAEAE